VSLWWGEEISRDLPRSGTSQRRPSSAGSAPTRRARRSPPLERRGSCKREPDDCEDCFSTVAVRSRIHDFFLFGTFLPFFRALERPIAIACLRLFTLPPLPPRPLLALPFLYRCISLLTSVPALFEYRLFFVFRAIHLSCIRDKDERRDRSRVPNRERGGVSVERIEAQHREANRLNKGCGKRQADREANFRYHLLEAGGCTSPAAERSRSSSIISISDHPRAVGRPRMAYCNGLLLRLCKT
jgi:hypothetical protein